MALRPVNHSGRYDTYEWELADGELSILSHCCGDHFDSEELLVLYQALKDHFLWKEIV